MKERYVLAHDLGTTGDKAVLFNVSSGRMMGSAFSPYPTEYPSPTWAEQDPEDWWRAFCAANCELLSRLGIDPRGISVISFSGQMMGCLPVARDGTPLRKAIIWADQRATAEAQALLERLDLEAIYKITGHRVGPAYSAPKIMWFKSHEPNLYRRTYKFLQAKDFIVYKLTGEWVTDYSDACGTGLLDIRYKRWSEEVLAVAGISGEMLPEIRSSTDVVGETGEDAEEAGLVPGIPIVIGGGDGVCATAGAGAVQPGIGHVYLGSSAWVAGASEAPLLDPKMRTFSWPHLDPRLYSPNGTMHNAGSALEWAKRALGNLESELARWLNLSPYDVLEKVAEQVPPGSEGLLFLPYIMGERSPHWNPNARGVFLGITRRHTKAHLLRAVYEGVALNLKAIYNALKESGVKLGEMRAIGGGAKSRLWLQILADAFGEPLTATEAPLEATALGAAMAGVVGVGLVEDLQAAAERFVGLGERTEPSSGEETYARLYPLFLDAYKALEPVFDLLVDAIGKGGWDEET